jgi:uncharacterized membrane protein YfcA
MTLAHTVLIMAAFIAGAQNALAGGGSFITFPALLYAGFDPLAANITSAVALFPGTVATSISGRRLVTGAAGLRVRALVLLSLAGGALGALLLVATPVALFNRIVPFLVPFATVVFAWGSFVRSPRGAEAAAHLGPRAAACIQLMIAIYGGYFAGGIGILMLAALTAAGIPVRQAGATKNLLAAVMGASSVLVFLLQVQFDWRVLAPVAAAAILGGQAGVLLLRRINETALCIGITLIGIGLTVALFLRS